MVIGIRNTYFSVLDDALLRHTLFDPEEDLLHTSQISTVDGERFTVVVVHELTSDTVAEDHGRIPREFAVEKLEGRFLVWSVEDGDSRVGFDR
jgi:hypothetical protein